MSYFVHRFRIITWVDPAHRFEQDSTGFGVLQDKDDAYDWVEAGKPLTATSSTGIIEAFKRVKKQQECVMTFGPTAPQSFKPYVMNLRAAAGSQGKAIQQMTWLLDIFPSDKSGKPSGDSSASYRADLQRVYVTKVDALAGKHGERVELDLSHGTIGELKPA